MFPKKHRQIKQINLNFEQNIIIRHEPIGIDKELLGGFAAKIRSLKRVEPYKGKGIRYSTEIVRRKQGKKAGATS